MAKILTFMTAGQSGNSLASPGPWLCSQRGGQLIQMAIGPRTFGGSISPRWSVISKPAWRGWGSVSLEHSASWEGRWLEAAFGELP